MLNPNEFKSIWEIAHRWEGYDPENSDPRNLPDSVIHRIENISWAFFRRIFPLREFSGRRILDERDLLSLLIFNWSRNRLIRCIERKTYPKKFLGGLYVLRPDLLKWCVEEFIDPPEFWQPASLGNKAGKTPIGRHRNEEMDKQLCQVIARTLWDIDPNIHPSHMAKSKALRQYGNGAHYKDENTVRRWIAEVDPLKDRRKTGNPGNTCYKIDLKTGRLAQDSAG